MMKRAELGGFIHGWKIAIRREETRRISCRLFADDILIFCHASEGQLTHLLWLLMWFEIWSGLKVNLHKSEVIPLREKMEEKVLLNLWAAESHSHRCWSLLRERKKGWCRPCKLICLRLSKIEEDGQLYLNSSSMSVICHNILLQ